MGKQFEKYVPIDFSPAKKVSDFPQKNQRMILDGVSLINLDITVNGEGTLEGTLLELLDHCCTPFGKRVLKQWICSPLCNLHSVNDRLNAIEDLMAHSDLMEKARGHMRTMPDVERLLRKIHALGPLRRSTDHPDSRAIMYNEQAYGKKKIDDLLSAVDGFDKALKIISLFENEAPLFSSKFLKDILIMKSDS